MTPAPSAASKFAQENGGLPSELFQTRHPYPFLLLERGQGTRLEPAELQTFGGGIPFPETPTATPTVEDVLYPVIAGAGAAANGKVTIGRSRDNDVVLPYAQVSKHHATIEPRGRPGAFRITDTGSTNGTAVNGVPLDPNEHMDLADGDLIAFGGDVPFRFLLPETLHLWLPALGRRAS